MSLFPLSQTSKKTHRQYFLKTKTLERNPSIEKIIESSSSSRSFEHLILQIYPRSIFFLFKKEKPTLTLMFALFEEIQILFSLVSYDNSRESSSSATFFNGITNSKWRLYLEETTFHRLFFIPSPPCFFSPFFPFKSVLLMDDFFFSSSSFLFLSLHLSSDGFRWEDWSKVKGECRKRGNLGTVMRYFSLWSMLLTFSTNFFPPQSSIVKIILFGYLWGMERIWLLLISFDLFEFWQKIITKYQIYETYNLLHVDNEYK